MRFFNTEGPVRPDKHYCVPPLARLDLDRILTFIRHEKYFVLHAPRQTGKTSALLALRDLLNAGSTGADQPIARHAARSSSAKSRMRMT